MSFIKPPLFVSMHSLYVSNSQRYITIGLYRDALTLYERLELWDGVIAAHQMLGQDLTAEAIVRARLDVEPKK